MSSDSSDVFDLIEERRQPFLEDLKSYLRFPSISTDPAHRDDINNCADYLCQQMEAAGLTAARLETGGNPLVYGEWTRHSDRPTVLFYGHYDVQPPDPLDEWESPPFEPTITGDRLVARGATDDKGQSFAHLKAVASTLECRGELPVNVKFLIEGEEESGGEAIDRYVTEDGGQKLACDCVLISDSSMLSASQPSLICGLRGILYFEILADGPNHDLHSGTYGGAVANPLNALCHLLGGLVDRATGRVSIPGFYDDVRLPEASERQGYSSVPFDEESYRNGLGVSELFGEEGFTTLERTWIRPTCDVNGVWGGYQGVGAKTVLPARAGAKVSMRLVPDQDPERIAEAFERHVRETKLPGVRVTVKRIHHASPIWMPVEGKAVEAATAAMEEVWGAPPIFVRDGGSIPIVSTFAQVLGVPVLLWGFGLPDDRLHSPNEKIQLSHFYKGIRSIVAFMDRLAG